jgi:parallel beta-helix repeat protein
VKFSATAGNSYEISTSNLGASCDTKLYLYDTDGTTQLEYNDDYPGLGLASKIVWTAPSSGTYFARIQHYNSGTYGADTEYDISVNETGASSPVKTVCSSGCNYTTIQAAIDAANPGDTIQVSAGTYKEDLTISKSVNLVGENSSSVIIETNGSSDIISVSADSVNISQISVLGNASVSTGIHVTANRFRISDSRIEGIANGFGIMLGASDYSTITNLAIDDADTAILIGASENSTVAKNTITSCRWGLWLDISNNNTINQNSITNASMDAVSLTYSPGNSLVGNIITSSRYGLNLLT